MVSTTKPQVMEASSLTKATIRWPLRGVHSGEGGAEDGHRVQIEGVSAGHAVKKHHAVSRQHDKRRFCRPMGVRDIPPSRRRPRPLPKQPRMTALFAASRWLGSCSTPGGRPSLRPQSTGAIRSLRQNDSP